jgi:hypothetical protein
MFDAHPDVAVMYEWNVVAELRRPVARYAGPGGVHVPRLVADLTAHPHVAASGVERVEIETALQSPVTGSTDAARRLFGMYARHFDKPRSGEKSTSYLLDLALVADVLPEARFIHIIRDGRDVALAATERGYGPPTISGVAFAWKRWVMAGRNAGHALGADRYIELRYEDLIDDPEHALRRLCEFVELDFHPAMLSYYEQGDRVCEGTADPERHPHLRLPPTKGLRDWRRDMRDDDMAVFSAVAGDVLAELGYELPNRAPVVDPETIVASWAAWRGWRRLTDSCSDEA